MSMALAIEKIYFNKVNVLFVSGYDTAGITRTVGGLYSNVKHEDVYSTDAT